MKIHRLLVSVLLFFPLKSLSTQESDAKAWNVNAPDFTAPATTVDLDLDEGTWMSVDVSPDGQHIVFDLLGNIYLIPVSGGEAELLVGDHSWDIQPRFSPDGRYIAFTSDRGGGDNIWTISLESQQLKQITFEDFRLLNSPVWTADGEYIAARKHFTTSRSLGTGEIWLYHASGLADTKGVPIIKKPSASYQKELGEPVFSPDGKYLYYTQNATAGDMFIYHEDTNKQVFNIKAFNLASRETSIVAGGPGGAVRPAPSPDGKSLAYIKRVESVSKLHIKALDSGIDTVVVNDLDPDLQETWGITGLYPNIAWLPDASGLVFWAGGKIRLVDLASGGIKTIPFRVQDSRTIYSPPRENVDVSPEQFETRMVRFASRSPVGTAVLFESLGKIWIKRGDKEPERLTKDKDGFEYSPVWSPDGRMVYFLNWQDDQLSSIRSVASRGGKSNTISIEPGHYSSLTVSADNRSLLLMKSKGSALTSPYWGSRPGIYLMAIKTGEMSFVTDRGFNPHFGANGRLFINERKRSTTGRGSDDAKTLLLSMNRSGFDVREEATSDLARVMLVSPDGQYIAHQQGFDVHVASRPMTGQPLDLGPRMTTLPARRVSQSGGLYMHWSNDSRSISWSIGPDYLTVEVADALFDDEVTRKAVNLSMSVVTSKPQGVSAITNARLITMNEERQVIDNATIVIEDNRILSLGTDLAIPRDAKVFDAEGKTIMPGMIDAHAHGPYGRGNVVPEQNYNALAHLALGVTTVHNPSSSAAQVFAAAEYQRAGKILAPRIFSTGNVVYGAKSVGFAPVSNIEDALRHIRRLKAQGAISIKNYNQPRREQRQQVIEAARREGMLVVAEGGSLYHMDMNLIADGSTGVEHNVPALNLYKDVIRFWGASQTGYTPTLVVVYGGLTSEDRHYAETDVWKHPILSKFVPPTVLQPRSVRRIKAPERDYRDDDAARAAKHLLEAGVVVNTGAHGQREGLATHWEMWSFAGGGMTAMQVLSLATINPAEYLGMANDLGSIEVGKLADLVIMNSNPLDNIYRTDDISHVMLNGRLYRAKDLSEEVTGNDQLEPFWFSEERNSQVSAKNE